MSSYDSYDYQRNCRVLSAVLNRFVASEVESSRGAGGIGSIEGRAMVTLYSLLREHPIDEWGRCRSCRRPGSVFGARWRPCRLHSKASLYLHQLDEVLLLSVLTEANSAGFRHREGEDQQG